MCSNALQKNDMKKFVWGLFFMLLSCQMSTDKNVIDILQQWQGREILLPTDVAFTIQGKDTVDFKLSGKWKILTYVDSLGCVSCKLQLNRWNDLIKALSEYNNNKSVQFLFSFSPEKEDEVLYNLKKDNFTYPICIDREQRINQLNHFPQIMTFQTFLLDKDNKVVAVGNPILNPKIKELYLNIIQGKTVSSRDKEVSVTTVSLPNRLLKLGSFPWQQPQTATFSFKNTGTLPLVIQDVSTSCGCTTVEYDPKPVQPGGSLDIQVTYKAEHPEHFDKTVTVYCNAEDSPIVLKIRGNAE